MRTAFPQRVYRHQAEVGALSRPRPWNATRSADPPAAPGGRKRWTETGYIFTGPLGAPLAPDHVGHIFQKLVRTHDVPPIRLHDLRHGAASLALSARVDLKVVQHQVGHSSIVTTADTYMSVMPQTAHEGAEATARLVQEAARDYSRSLRHKTTTRTRPASLRQLKRKKAA